MKKGGEEERERERERDHGGQISHMCTSKNSFIGGFHTAVPG